MAPVSVIISVLNGEKFIREAIQSVLEQSHQDFELILIDDGSTDNTLQIMQEFASVDHRIIIDSHENIGMAGSVNRALKSAKHDLVARMDGDDVMLKDRLKKQVRFMVENSHIACISCLANYINEDGKNIGRTYSDLKSVTDGLRYMEKNEPIGLLHSGVMYRKQAVIAVGGYRGSFWPADDIDLWNRLHENGYNIIVLQEILVNYRLHNTSVITSGFEMSRKKFDWLRHCMMLRRSGKKEISLEEFLTEYNKRSYFYRVNKIRKNFSKYYYRNAAFSFASRKYFAFLKDILLAFCLQPSYVVPKIIKQKLL